MRYIIFCFLFLVFLIPSYADPGDTPFIVLEEETKLCGEFQKGNSESPNWLENGWEAAFLNKEIQGVFANSESCKAGQVASCCRELGYKFAGVPIGENQVSQQRQAAEFLAAKGFIETKSFNPHEYRLDQTITRKEFMKIIMNVSEKNIEDSCEEYFEDMPKDWSCKYITAALNYQFISKNNLFRPNDTISISEALKLVYKSRYLKLSFDDGSWQENYISSSYYRGYLDVKTTNYTQVISRGEVFQIIARTYPLFSYRDL